jgi:hypothetical protein
MPLRRQTHDLGLSAPPPIRIGATFTEGLQLVRKIAAGLTGLGLVGGAGAVTYNDDGTAKVTITDGQGHKQSVQIGGGNGQSYKCPDGTEAKLESVDIRAGRIKITLQRVEKSLDAIEARYPGRKAPDAVVTRHNRLVKRDKALIHAYNASIDEHNMILETDCEAQ